MKNPDILREADDEIRATARALLDGARHAALAVLVADPGAPAAPFVSRIALGRTPEGTPMSLVSSLAIHTGALRTNPACSILVGEPGTKGDPLVHPRLTLQCHAKFVARDAPGFAALRDMWLSLHPKAKLYVDFADFSFVRFAVRGAFLNGGFGLASALKPGDLGIEPAPRQA